VVAKMVVAVPGQDVEQEPPEQLLEIGPHRVLGNAIKNRPGQVRVAGRVAVGLAVALPLVRPQWCNRRTDRAGSPDLAGPALGILQG